MAKAIWEGAVLAESSDTVIVEGNHYFQQIRSTRNISNQAVIRPSVIGGARLATTTLK
jgi:hypothetical protein